MYLIIWKSGENWVTGGPYVDEEEAKWRLKEVRENTQKAAIVLTEDVAKMAGIV